MGQAQRTRRLTHAGAHRSPAGKLTKPPVVYRIDAEDRLTQMNDAWARFAATNESPGLTPTVLVGRSIWDFVADTTTRLLYKTMVARVRSGAPPIRFDFRCDAPTVRRQLTMAMALEPAGVVQFTVTPVREEARPAVPMVSASAGTSGQAPLVTACSWCNRLRLHSGKWSEIEQALGALGFFTGGDEPRLTHGMCPECLTALEGALEEPVFGASGALSLGALTAA